MLSDTEILERLYVYGRIRNTWPIDPELIHRQQRDNGYEACYGRAVAWCEHEDCCWREHCLAMLDAPPAVDPLWLTLDTNA